jgi:hypothetical protein
MAHADRWKPRGQFLLAVRLTTESSSELLESSRERLPYLFGSWGSSVIPCYNTGRPGLGADPIALGQATKKQSAGVDGRITLLISFDGGDHAITQSPGKPKLTPVNGAGRPLAAASTSCPESWDSPSAYSLQYSVMSAAASVAPRAEAICQSSQAPVLSPR